MSLPSRILFAICVLGGLLLAGAAATPAGASETIISVNISASPTGNSAIDGDETFGVPSEGTVVGTWNNIASWANAHELLRADGTVSGVSAASRNPAGEVYWGAGYINTPWNYGIAHYVATPNPGTLSFSNLAEEFPAGYYAIVYVNGAPANQGAAITDGATTYYFQSSNSHDPTPIRMTKTVADGTYPIGNYAVFGSPEAPLTADSITFNIPVGSVVSNNAGIGGAQIIGIPGEADSPVPTLAIAIDSASGNVTLIGIGKANASYRFEMSEDLTAWLPLGETKTADAEGKVSHEDAEASVRDRRFYRLVEQ